MGDLDDINEKYDSGDHTPGSGEGETKESAYGPMKQQSVRLPEEAVELIKKEGQKLGLGKTTMMRQIIMRWVSQRKSSQDSKYRNQSSDVLDAQELDLDLDDDQLEEIR